MSVVYTSAKAATPSTPILKLAQVFTYPSGQGTLTSVAGINNSGTVVGQATTTSGVFVGFEKLSNGTVTTLEYPGSSSTDALGINDSSTIVGSWQNASAVTSGFSLSNGVFTAVNHGPGNIAVLGINDSNDFVGWWTAPSGVTQAFVAVSDAFTPVSVQGAVTSFMSGINNATAQAVGDYTDHSGNFHAFIYTIASGTISPSNYPSATQTELLGINTGGALVGLYYDSAGKIHGLAKSGTTWLTYDYPGAKSTSLTGINDQGKISGSFVDSSNKVHGLILTLTTTTGPTPTPTSTLTPTPTPTLTPTPTPTLRPTPTPTLTPTPTPTGSSSPSPTATPTPLASAIKHIIVVFQENRTPDNLFGSNPTFEPGVDLVTSGVNSTGEVIPLTPDAIDDCYDLRHGHTDFVNEYDNGKMDGADLVPVQTGPNGCDDTPTNPQFKFADNSTGTIQPYFDIATAYGYANRMFSSQQGPSFPGHQFIFAGTSAPTEFSDLFASEDPTDGIITGCLAPPQATVPLIDPTGNETTNPAVYPCLEHPTMSDSLNAANISWKYYAPMNADLYTAPDAIDHICVPQTVGGVLTCTGTAYTNGQISIPQTNVLTDISNCNLPTVSWVVPTAADSDHAGGNMGLGPSWVASIVNQVGQNPACASGELYWNDTAIFVTWDDWGGWYDHVPSYQIGESTGWGTGFVYGLRVPLLVISAYTPQGYVDNTNHDFGSILRFIEVTNNLPLIGPGTYADAYADDMEEFFPLTSPRPFTSIAAPMNGKDFLQYPLPLEPPDDD